MKILYFTSIPSPFQIEFIQSCKDYLSPSSIEMYCTKPLTQERIHWGNDSKSYTSIPSKNVKTAIQRLLDEKQPDVVVITDYKSLLSYYIYTWAIRNNRIFYIGPIEIMHQRNFIIDKIKKYIFSQVAKKANGIIAIGNMAARYYGQLYKGPIINIPYSFGLSNLLNSVREVNSGNELVFLYSGRLEPFRDPLRTINIFAKIVKNNPAIKLKLIISGKGSLEEKCKELIDHLEIADKTEWITEFGSWYEIHKIYTKADILLSLQQYSGWGIIIQEAMAAGMGIIASNTICAADDLIVNNYNGFLVNKSNENEIINCMQTYIDKPELCKVHGIRSREIVKTIDVSITSKRFIDFIKQNKEKAND